MFEKACLIRGPPVFAHLKFIHPSMRLSPMLHSQSKKRNKNLQKRNSSELSYMAIAAQDICPSGAYFSSLTTKRDPCEYNRLRGIILRYLS